MGTSRPNILRTFSIGVEFWARLLMVNLPSYVLANSIASDRLCMALFTYLLFQVVGITWASLVNAAFALACELSYIVNTSTTVRLIFTFYIYYASLRVVIVFAQSTATLALQNLENFPDACRLLAANRATAPYMALNIFVPALLLEMGLLTADWVCPQTEASAIGTETNDDTLFLVCKHTGLHFLTSAYPEMRRLMFYSLVTMVLQLWQTALNQFPRWEEGFRSMTTMTRIAFQTTVFLLFASTAVAMTSAVVLGTPNNSSKLTYSEESLFLVLTGWTLWLLFFLPTLINVHGPRWKENTSPATLAQLAAHLRISLIFIIGVIFVSITITSGFLRAQLDTTLLSLTLPALYVCVYLVSNVALKLEPTLACVCAVVSALVALFLHSRIAADIGGQGSTLLVFFHCFSRLVHMTGGDMSMDAIEALEEHDDEGVERGDDGAYIWHEISTPMAVSENVNANPSFESESAEMQSKEQRKFDSFGKDTNYETANPVTLPAPGPPTQSHNSAPLRGISNRPRALLSTVSSSLSLDGLASDTDGAPTMRRVASMQHEAMQSLATRGSHTSSHVSLGLDESIKNHWTVRLSQRNVNFVANIVARIVPDSFVSAVVRAGIALIVVLSLLLGLISLASLAQQNLQYFPKFISFNRDEVSGSIHIDHTIAHLILHTNTTNDKYLWQKRQVRLPWQKVVSVSTPPAKTPYYAACDWSWNGLTVLDFSLLSELAYMDESPQNLQRITSTLFPQYFDSAQLKRYCGGRVSSLVPRSVNSSREVALGRSDDDWCADGGGPTFLEMESSLLDVTVVAIRGTDVGRLQDFMEDVKLYAEPVVFTLLSTVFPSIRLWSGATTSAIIQILYDTNAFFGLQGEAEYYRPLVNRVEELSKRGRNVVITGHSLGGGLARIVASLTGLPSVSFSPPGLELSHRKYSVREVDGTLRRLDNKNGALHHKSVAVVTETDVISQVDNQVGLVQRIQCDATDRAHQNACHLLEGTACHLLEHCGDTRGRFTACSFEFDLGAIMPQLWRYINAHRLILLPLSLFLPIMLALAIVPELL